MTDVEKLKKEMVAMRDLEAITNMLEQVAARDIAKMRNDILESRAFFREVWRVYRALSKITPPPPQVIRKQLVVAIGIDWGMPGDLLGRMLKEAVRLQKLHDADMVLAGKKTHRRYRHNDGHTVHYFSVPKNPTLKDLQPIYRTVAGYADVTFVYPHFDSLSKQSITTASFSTSDESGIEDADAAHIVEADRYLTDPDPQTLANYLNEAVVGITFHHYFSEAMLAYSAAQMVAMRNGNNNAGEAVKELKIHYNQARRANIDAKIRELYGAAGARK